MFLFHIIQMPQFPYMQEMNGKFNLRLGQGHCEELISELVFPL